MEQKKNAFPIAAVLFCVCALDALVSIARYFYFPSFLLMAAYIFAAVWMFMGKKDFILAIPFGVMGLTKLVLIFLSRGLFNISANLLCFLALVLVVAFILMRTTSLLDTLKANANTLRIILFVACGLALLMNLLSYIFWGYFSFFSIFRPFWYLIMDAVFYVALVLTVFWLNMEEPAPGAQYQGGNQGYYAAPGAQQYNFDPETGQPINRGGQGQYNYDPETGEPINNGAYNAGGQGQSGYNPGYNAGGQGQNGYNPGYNAGGQNGYNSGYDAGGQGGYNQGYNGPYGAQAGAPGYFGDCIIDMAKHVLLLIFTFGIWHLIWIYNTTERLNRVPGVEQYSATNKLLLCLFIPFYSIYWYYRHGERMDTLTRIKGFPGSDLATLCLVLAIFVPIVPAILLQDRMNGIGKMDAGIR